MENLNRKYICAYFEEDGNPKIETNCMELESAALCAALLAAFASASGISADYLETVVTEAANLLDRVEVDV